MGLKCRGSSTEPLGRRTRHSILSSWRWSVDFEASTPPREQLQCLWQGARVRPRFVQNRCYAVLGWDRRVREFCQANGVVYQGFSLLTSLLRKPFTLASPVKRALARVSALGLYQLRFNGHPVGENVLSPEWTDYNTRVQYQTYDVTELLRGKGEHTVAAVLGDGWYTGRIGLAGIVPNGPAWGLYGLNPKLILCLEVELADGTRTEVVSDESWRVSTDGPIRENDILDGEIHDGRKQLLGWDQPGFDDSGWSPVRLAQNVTRLVAQPNEPIRVIKELQPVAVAEPKPGVWVFDLGQNMVGRCRLTAEAPAGTTVTLRFGEAVNPEPARSTQPISAGRSRRTSIRSEARAWRSLSPCSPITASATSS